MKFFIPVDPIGAVRMTRRGKFVKPDAQRYLSYKSLVGHYMRKHCDEPIQGPIKLSVTFYMPIPLSDSKKKKAEKKGKPATVKPDIDNLLKGLFDAANGIMWPDDNAVCELVNVRKVYDNIPGIYLEVITDGEESA